MDSQNERLGSLMAFSDIGLILSTFGVLLAFNYIIDPISSNTWIVCTFFVGIKILIVGIADVTGIGKSAIVSAIFILIADAVIIFINYMMAFGISLRMLLVMSVVDVVIILVAVLLWKSFADKEYGRAHREESSDWVYDNLEPDRSEFTPEVLTNSESDAQTGTGALNELFINDAISESARETANPQEFGGRTAQGSVQPGGEFGMGTMAQTVQPPGLEDFYSHSFTEPIGGETFLSFEEITQELPTEEDLESAARTSEPASEDILTQVAQEIPMATEAVAGVEEGYGPGPVIELGTDPDFRPIEDIEADFDYLSGLADEVEEPKPEVSFNEVTVPERTEDLFANGVPAEVSILSDYPMPEKAVEPEVEASVSEETSAVAPELEVVTEAAPATEAVVAAEESAMPEAKTEEGMEAAAVVSTQSEEPVEEANESPSRGSIFDIFKKAQESGQEKKEAMAEAIEPQEPAVQAEAVKPELIQEIGTLDEPEQPEAIEESAETAVEPAIQTEKAAQEEEEPGFGIVWEPVITQEASSQEVQETSEKKEAEPKEESAETAASELKAEEKAKKPMFVPIPSAAEETPNNVEPEPAPTAAEVESETAFELSEPEESEAEEVAVTPIATQEVETETLQESEAVSPWTVSVPAEERKTETSQEVEPEKKDISEIITETEERPTEELGEETVEQSIWTVDQGVFGEHQNESQEKEQMGVETLGTIYHADFERLTGGSLELTHGFDPIAADATQADLDRNRAMVMDEAIRLNNQLNTLMHYYNKFLGEDQQSFAFTDFSEVKQGDDITATDRLIRTKLKDIIDKQFVSENVLHDLIGITNKINNRNYSLDVAEENLRERERMEADRRAEQKRREEELNRLRAEEKKLQEEKIRRDQEERRKRQEAVAREREALRQRQEERERIKQERERRQREVQDQLTGKKAAQEQTAQGAKPAEEKAAPTSTPSLKNNEVHLRNDDLDIIIDKADLELLKEFFKQQEANNN